MIANALVASGHRVTQFISNFEHRSKTFRNDCYESRSYGPNYSISIIPSTSYKSHISLSRVKYERSYAKNLIKYVADYEKPDIVILAEPALCYYNIILRWIKKDLKAKIIIDLIDIWPELFHLLFPKSLNFLANLIFFPLYMWRRRLYRSVDGLVAVSKNYQDIALKIKPFKPSHTDVVYWSIPENEINKEELISNKDVINLIESKGLEEVWCIYAGTLGENYDVKSIIDAGEELKKIYSHNRFKLIIAGDGPLADFCIENSDQKSIVFLGRLSSTDLAGLFRHCDIALSTYRQRSTVSMPIKAFDYFAFGLPLVNSLKRDLGYFINKMEIGINYEAESVSALTGAIKILVDDKDKRLQMKENALIASTIFSENLQYSKFIYVIENVYYGK
ncbi:glycosyltransferase [Pedobacter heparinus]|nr:glycosyltransferase [Pedobacter heparinus]